jgi:DNA-binding response OmpR family regulator
MTSFVEEDRVHAALDAGAAGYLLKDADADELIAAVPGRAPRRTDARPCPGQTAYGLAERAPGPVPGGRADTPRARDPRP